MSQCLVYQIVSHAMYKIISPDQFKTIAWKNGQGETTELAISPGGTLTDFDWRLSMASVVENGAFSDFGGYDRQLILLNGPGIKLTHDHHQVDELTAPLSIAAFDGASHTVGELMDGPIKDFNVMTQQGRFNAAVKTFTEQTSTTFSAAPLNFIYAALESIVIQRRQENIELAQGHMLQVTADKEQDITVSGQGFIVILIQTLV